MSDNSRTRLAPQFAYLCIQICKLWPGRYRIRFGKLLEIGENSALQVLVVRHSVETMKLKCQLSHSARN
jgi:hypothetical protein